MPGKCLHERPASFNAHKRDCYKESLPSIPHLVLDAIDHESVGDLDWFDATALYPLKHEDNQVQFALVTSPRRARNIVICRDLKPGISQKKAFLIAWSWSDRNRRVQNRHDIFQPEWSDIHQYTYVYAVLKSGLSKSGAQRHARRLQKALDEAAATAKDNRTLKTIGTLCRSRAGMNSDIPVHIGDIVTRINSHNYGWLWQIVEEEEYPKGLGKVGYSFTLQPCFVGLRTGARPSNKTAPPHRIKPVSLTELGALRAGLDEIINSCARLRGAN